MLGSAVAVAVRTGRPCSRLFEAAPVAGLVWCPAWTPAFPVHPDPRWETSLSSPPSRGPCRPGRAPWEGASGRFSEPISLPAPGPGLPPCLRSGPCRGHSSRPQGSGSVWLRGGPATERQAGTANGSIGVFGDHSLCGGERILREGDGKGRVRGEEEGGLGCVCV